MIFLRSIIVGTIMFFSLFSFSQNERDEYTADVSSIQNILDAYYDCISGPIGEVRDFDRLKNMFHKTANFTYTYWDETEEVTKTMYFENIDEYLGKLGYMDKKGFYEKEIANTINEFGSISQVFSTYKYWSQDNSIPPNKGITSFEILFDGNRYWIISMFWSAESSRYKIPAKYLGSK